jgi:hypothetical protein
MSHCLPDGYNILSASAGAGILLGYLSRHHEPELEDGEAPAGQSAAESELAYQKAAFAELAAQNSRMLATASLSLPKLAAGEAPKVGLRRQAETFDVEGEAPKMQYVPFDVQAAVAAAKSQEAGLEPEIEAVRQPPAVPTWDHHHGTAAADAESQVRRARELSEQLSEQLSEPAPDSRESTALRNYEEFHSIPRGTATLDQVARSSAGVSGWSSHERSRARAIAAAVHAEQEGGVQQLDDETLGDEV